MSRRGFIGYYLFLERGYCTFILLVKFGEFLAAAASNIFSASHSSYSPSETLMFQMLDFLHFLCYSKWIISTKLSLSSLFFLLTSFAIETIHWVLFLSCYIFQFRPFKWFFFIYSISWLKSSIIPFIWVKFFTWWSMFTIASLNLCLIIPTSMSSWCWHLLIAFS